MCYWVEILRAKWFQYILCASFSTFHIPTQIPRWYLSFQLPLARTAVPEVHHLLLLTQLQYTNPALVLSSHLEVPIIQQKYILVFYRFQYNGTFTKKRKCVHTYILSFCYVTSSNGLFQHFISQNILEYACTYVHIQTHMIKSIETYCILYVEKFKKSVIFKSGIYQMLFHTVTLTGFSSFGFEPTGIRLKTSHTLLSHTILLLIPEMNPNRLFLILLKAEAGVMVSVHISDRR